MLPDDPLQARVAAEMLGWGGPRPTAPPGLSAALTARIEHAAPPAPAPAVVVDRRRLLRRVCDGWQHDGDTPPPPSAAARGALLRAVIAQDLRAGCGGTVTTRVHEHLALVAETPVADPGSVSAWLQRQPAPVVAALRTELGEVLSTVRGLWPARLLAGRAELHVRRTRSVRLAGGQLTLVARPDVELVSPVVDDRARTLIVELVTARPRPVADRTGLRLSALVHTLRTGIPPFRWVSLHVTDGRFEAEDLSPAPLERIAEQVATTAAQLARLGAGGEHRLTAGEGCTWCRRSPTCPTAAAAGLSHP